jgi:hypothetical protein
MKTVIVLILFLGVFFVINGVYEQKIQNLQTKEKIVYKFVPRTYYEEQLRDANLDEKLYSMYNTDSPWVDKTIGSKIDIPKQE